MTTDEALSLIRNQIETDDSDLRNRLAQAGLNGGIGAMNRLGEYWWNQQKVEFTLTASATGEYKIRDLWPDYSVRRIEPKIWYVGTTNWIEIVSLEEFSDSTEHKYSTTGQPRIGTVHSNDSILEVWPCAASSYACKVFLYYYVNGLEQIPEEYHDLIVSRALMLAVPSRLNGKDNILWVANKDAWESGKTEIIARRDLTAWTGNQIGADKYVTQSTTASRSRRADSMNLMGN